jgi:hypothetical protein
MIHNTVSKINEAASVVLRALVNPVLDNLPGCVREIRSTLRHPITERWVERGLLDDETAVRLSGYHCGSMNPSLP